MPGEAPRFLPGDARAAPPVEAWRLPLVAFCAFETSDIRFRTGKKLCPLTQVFGPK